MNRKTAIKLPSDSADVTVKHPKSHKKYWLVDGRLFTQHGSRDYCCRFSHKGRRGFFDLDSPNKEPAANQAAKIYRYVVAHGWEAAEKEFRTITPAPKVEALTVGRYIEKVREVALVAPRSITAYEQALRLLAGEAVGDITHKGSKEAEWRTVVNETALSDITAHSVARWMKSRLDDANGEPTAEEAAKHTINSILRSAKALFSKNILPRLDEQTKQALPSPRPLSDVRLLPEDSSARFVPDVDPEALLVLARDELAAAQKDSETPEAFALREQTWVAFLLCFCGGLRRKEADLLTWWSVRLDDQERPRIELQTTKYLRLKNAAHAKPIPLEKEVAAILRGYRAKRPTDEFVLYSADAPILSKNSSTRCPATWGALKTWLKAKGIEDDKPVHALRKSVGSLMARRHGIHAAQRLLRHTTPLITSKYYSDAEARETPGIGGLLAGNVKQVDFRRQSKPTRTRTKRHA